MNFRLCTSSSEVTTPNFESLRCNNMDFLVPNSFARAGFINRKVKMQVSNCETRKMLISGDLIPGQLEGSLMGKKRLEEATQKLDFVRTLLVDNYDSYTYNIYQDLSVINGVPPMVVRNDDWTWKDVTHYLYKEKAFDNIVISPGPGSPTHPADIGICLQLLLECSDIPILGVCLGHQALGYVHGAEIVHASEPVHGRLSEVEHTGCRLFHGIPSGRDSGFKVVRYHSLVIDAESLPRELIPIAWTSSTDTLSFLDTPESDVISDAYQKQINQKVCLDSLSAKYKNERSWSCSQSKEMRRRKVLMGIMHSTRPHYGVQFHPESVGSCYGRQIFKNFREITEDYWLRLGPSFLNERKVHTLVPHSRSSIHKFLKLKWRKFDCLASQIGGAERIFCELFGHLKAENTFWLDSSSTEKGRADFSFMGGKGGSLWKQLTFRLSDQSGLNFKGGGYLSINDAQGSTKSIFLEDGFLDFLDKELLSYHYEEKDYEGLPFDFYGGYIGYLGYNLKVESGMASNSHKSRTPDACFFFADNFVVVDHFSDDVYIVSITEGTRTSSSWLDITEQKLLNLKASDAKLVREHTSQHMPFSQSKSGFVADKSRAQYVEDVEKCLKFIKDGESYELCLTTQMRKSVGQMDSLGLYLYLRQENPSPYAAWLNFSKENLSICSSSPERFLRLDRNGILEAKPIKGTISRGVTQEKDEELKRQLQLSEKDQAENLMIVDLLRNDLGRVCKPGSVHVPHLMEVESYATVHTMVSTIRGKKCDNVSAIDCVRAAFPGGSMTGAPKLRSMELLDSLESCSRGIYSGCIGYFSCNRTFDLNIVIRTVVIHEGEASIGAGGAITALSNPDKEHEEMVLKTRAPVKAVMEFQSRSESNY